jgi:type IV pilus assembly protein PilQ
MTNVRQGMALMLIFVVLGFCAIGIAQQTQQPQAAAPAALTDVQQKMNKIISVEFRDTPIDEVLRSIAQQADLDLVKGPDITGNVTATLTDVPLGEALDQILTAYKCGYVASENIIRIVPSSQLTADTEKLVNKIYRIYYADVTQLEQAMAKFVSQRGRVTANKDSSNIIVTDTETNIKAIEEFLEEIDRETPQILVEARIYDITNTDGLDLGIEWTAGRNTGMGITAATGETVGFSRSDPYIDGTFNSSTNKAVGATGTLNFGLLNEHINIDTLMSAQRIKDAAKLLANPRILVLDNVAATFDVIREIPYQELQQGGYQSFGTTEFKEVGVKLQVTPHLTKDGKVKIHIVPEFSVQVDNVSLTLVGASGTGGITMPQPVVDKRKADTTALVQDGQTVVIGGLRKQEITQEISKIPLLGDIPLVGWIFKFEGEQTVNSELVVFITPRIIEEPVLTDTETRYLEATEIVGPQSPSTKIDPATRELSK